MLWEKEGVGGRQRVWVTEKYPSAHILSDGGLVAGVTKKNPPGHVSSDRGGWRQAGSVGDKKTPLTRIWSEEGGWVVVWWVKTENTPPTHIWSKEGGMDYKHPLQLAFEAREGGWVVVWWMKTKKPPLQLVFEAREGDGWCCGGWRLKTPPLVRYISLCVTLTVTVFISQLSHLKSLASNFGLQVISTVSMYITASNFGLQSLNQIGYGPWPLDCAFTA